MPQQSVGRIVIRGFIPEMAPAEMCLDACVNGQYQAESVSAARTFRMAAHRSACSLEPLTLNITGQRCSNPNRAGVNEDNRNLLSRILELRFLHV